MRKAILGFIHALCKGHRFGNLQACFMSVSFLILLQEPIDRPVYSGTVSDAQSAPHGNHETQKDKPIFPERERGPMSARAAFDCVLYA